MPASWIWGTERVRVIEGGGLDGSWLHRRLRRTNFGDDRRLDTSTENVPTPKLGKASTIMIGNLFRVTIDQAFVRDHCMSEGLPRYHNVSDRVVGRGRFLYISKDTLPCNM